MWSTRLLRYTSKLVFFTYVTFFPSDGLSGCRLCDFSHRSGIPSPSESIKSVFFIFPLLKIGQGLDVPSRVTFLSFVDMHFYSPFLNNKYSSNIYDLLHQAKLGFNEATSNGVAY